MMILRLTAKECGNKTDVFEIEVEIAELRSRILETSVTIATIVLTSEQLAKLVKVTDMRMHVPVEFVKDKL